jgi:hypothetical protein
MQLFDRLFKIKKHQQKSQNDNKTASIDSNSTTSSSTLNQHSPLKRLSSLRHWRSSSKAISHSNTHLNQVQQQQQQQQQDLLTQCIETALYVNPNNNNSNNGKRWSLGDAPTSNKISFHEQEPSLAPPQPRQRKLSLPPQLINMGYLASIPEVDSQITLALNK